jgi:hypothetical protein
MAFFLHSLQQALRDAAPTDVAVVYHLMHVRDRHERLPRN